MREVAMYLGGLVAGAGLWASGYYFGKADLFRKIMDYYSIRHAANPMEGQDLLRFLQK